MMTFLYRFNRWLLFGTVAVMVLVTIMQVISRYFFGYSFVWSDELAKFMLVWTTFIGTCVGIRDKEMPSMELFENSIKGKLKVIHKFLLHALNLFFIGFLLYYSAKLATQPSVYLQVSPALRLPMIYVYMIVPISCVFMILLTIGEIVQFIRNRRAGT